ncbi:hypothetical protein GCM10022419_011700 [Nonomuraea rosea]|uniref:WXG100 family type VII secretion target n=1 Tax=Nonomuraea rosea TaxID=638574 RepID=A0ABP6VEI1_9ACTN
MTEPWNKVLKDSREPQIDDIAPTAGGDSDSSDGVRALIDATDPERVAAAGHNYRTVAEKCNASVEVLYRQAQRVADTLGGESVKGILGTIGELQRDLARINFAAESVARPLIWYGEQVLPWFKRNTPGTGSVGLDDSIGDTFGSDTNGHALARHHLKQLNRFMGDAYNAIPNEMVQRTTAPQTGMADPPFSLPTGIPTGVPGAGDPYAGSGLPPSSYGTPGFGDPASGPASTNPAFENPSTQSPGTDVPGLKDPSLQDPSPQDPSVKDPSTQTTSAQTPNLSAPQTPNPALNTPNLSQVPSTRTDLSALQPANVPILPAVPPTGLPPGTPTGPGLTSGSAPVTQLGSSTSFPGGGRAMAAGTSMGMMPPMMGGGQAGQDKDRERTRFPLVEDESFESDDMGGPSVIA